MRCPNCSLTMAKHCSHPDCEWAECAKCKTLADPYLGRVAAKAGGHVMPNEPVDLNLDPDD